MTVGCWAGRCAGIGVLCWIAWLAVGKVRVAEIREIGDARSGYEWVPENIRPHIVRK